MPRIAIAQVIRECTACGQPATAGRYCHECVSNVRTTLDVNCVTGKQYDEPQGGQA